MRFRWSPVALGAASVAAAVLVVTVAARATARHYTFPAAEAAESAAPLGFEVLSFDAGDGVGAHAFYAPAQGHERTIAYFHNNRETACSRAELALAFHRRGMGVLLVEYRGYGVSRGAAPSEQGLYLDAERALDALQARGVGAERVVLWGTSLGTGVAAEMARRGRGAKLVLEAPYTSIPDLVSAVAPAIPASLLVPDHFATLEKAAAIRTPTLVIHGDADEIIPFWMSERLAHALPDARLRPVLGARHGDVFARGGEALIAEIAAFGG